MIGCPGNQHRTDGLTRPFHQGTGDKPRHICDGEAGAVEIAFHGNTGDRSWIRRGVEHSVAVAVGVAGAVLLRRDANDTGQAPTQQMCRAYDERFGRERALEALPVRRVRRAGSD